MTYIRKFILLIIIPSLFFGGYIASNHYGLAINTDDSLKGKVFFLKKGIAPTKRGQYIVFKVKNNEKLKKPFIKLVGGFSTDIITTKDKAYFINGEFKGFAKEFSKKGKATKLTKEGVIPNNKYFVYTNHKDSYDSKYEDIGLIDKSDVIGVAYPIF